MHVDYVHVHVQVSVYNLIAPNAYNQLNNL